MRNNSDRLAGSVGSQQDPADPTQNQISYIVPTEHVPLPSGGLFYPSHHPLHKKDVIEIKQMTAKEEDILTSKNLLKKGVALDKLIQSLVIDKRINPDTLTMEDRGAIIVAARVSAYGDDYTTTVACPSCETKNSHTINLYEKLHPTSQTVVGVDVDDAGHFLVTLPKTNWVLKCRVLTGYDEKELLRLGEEKKKSRDGDSLLSDQLKMIIIAINDIEDREVVENAVDNMPSRDAKFLRKVYQENLSSIELESLFVCQKCEFEGKVEVPLTADFFWAK